MRAISPVVLAVIAVIILPTTLAAGPVTISGLVAYREPLPLPPGAVATIRLLEDGAPVAQTQADERRAPPLPFELVYDDALIIRDTAYALSAEVTFGERVLFRSASPQPLRSPDTSQKVSLVVSLVRD